MERIDLNMPCYGWFAYAVVDVDAPRIPFRFGMIIEREFKRVPMKDFCKMSRQDLILFRGMGVKCIKVLTAALSYYGLRLGMTQEEIDAYIAAYNLDNGIFVKEDTLDEIDWERRRWETAQMFLSRTFDLSYEEAIIMADEFIEEYKKSLTKFAIL